MTAAAGQQRRQLLFRERERNREGRERVEEGAGREEETALVGSGDSHLTADPQPS